jgi:hypothetical protein
MEDMGWWVEKIKYNYFIIYIENKRINLSKNIAFRVQESLRK